jgi:hypothetical protein
VVVEEEVPDEVYALDLYTLVVEVGICLLF